MHPPPSNTVGNGCCGCYLENIAIPGAHNIGRGIVGRGTDDAACGIAGDCLNGADGNNVVGDVEMIADVVNNSGDNADDADGSTDVCKCIIARVSNTRAPNMSLTHNRGNGFV